MRSTFLSIFLLTFAACGSNQDQTPPITPTPVDCGSNKMSVNTMCMNPEVAAFKTASGYEGVSNGDVTGVHVKVYKPVGSNSTGTDVDLERDFVGGDAIHVVRQLGLFEPNEGASPASITTGEITVRFRRKTDTEEQSRTLTIQNSRLIEDSGYSDVTYKPYTALDKAWLEQQPMTITGLTTAPSGIRIVACGSSHPSRAVALFRNEGEFQYFFQTAYVGDVTAYVGQTYENGLGVANYPQDREGTTALPQASNDTWTYPAPGGTFFTARGGLVGEFLYSVQGDPMPHALYVNEDSANNGTNQHIAIELTCTDDLMVAQQWVNQVGTFIPLK